MMLALADAPSRESNAGERSDRGFLDGPWTLLIELL